MYTIRRLFVWLMRAGHCRGFGVQSPSDYAFIRYIINEHYPYYAYADLERELPDIDKRTRKLCRLYLRLANFVQPTTAVDWREGQDDGTPFARYITAGCRKTNIVGYIDGIEHIDLLRIGITDMTAAMVDKAIGLAHSRSVFVVEGIHRNRKARECWNKLVEDKRTGVTFDLYYAGILMFDNKKYKHNYIINF